MTARPRKAPSRLRRYAARLDVGLLAALFIPLLAIMPLLTHAGLPNTADGPVHLMRQVELNQAWDEGNYYPRWGTDLALGHGMPIFSYAPPLLYHLTQLLHLAGLPLDESMKGVVVLDFLLYSVGMFLFTRRVYGSWPALAAAAVYVYAPYRLREAYIQGNYGQFTGLAFYPLIFWAFHGLITEGRPRYWLLAPLALAGLLFSHNISFMLFAPIFGAYLLFLIGLTAAGYRSQGTGDREAREHGLTESRRARASRATIRTPEPELQNSKSFFLLTPYSVLLFRPILAGLLGLGLAAIFWLPAFGERHDIKLEGITQGFFDFRENFISLREFLSPPLPLDLAAINPEFPLSLGLPQLAGAVLGVAALAVWLAGRIAAAQSRRAAGTQGSSGAESKKQTTNDQPTSHLTHHSSFSFRNTQLLHTLFFTLFLLFYAYLALPYSQWLWEAAPLLELTEFPWRMLGPAIFCASVLTAAGVSWLITHYCAANENSVSRQSEESPNSTAKLTLDQRDSSLPAVARNDIATVNSRCNYALLITHLMLFLIIAFNAYYLYPSQFIQWGTPTPADAFAYEVTSGAIGTTSTGEFLPRWAQQHPEPDTLWPDYAAGRPPQILDPAALPAGASAETVSYRSESSEIQIDTPRPFVATLRSLYWPGWQLYLNGQPAPFEITPQTGLIQTTIPAGQHSLTLQLESTPLRTAGLWLSIAALVGLIVTVTWAAYHHQPSVTGHRSLVSKPETQNPELKTRNSELGTQNFYDSSLITHHSLLIITAFLFALYLLSRPLAPLFTLQSDPNRPAPADRHPGADFGDQIRLVGVDEWPAVIYLDEQGRADLTVVLYWRALQDLETNYSVFLHLDAPDGQTLATVDEVNPEDIPTRNWPPGLYLRNPLHLVSGTELPPIRYNLTTGVYDRVTGKRLPLAGGQETAYTLGVVWLAGEPPDVPPTPLATFGPQLTLHQARLDAGQLTLVWRAAAPIAQHYSIFVHVLDGSGQILSQVDGVPYGGLYPLPHWRPGQLVEDVRPIDLPPGAVTIALGVYEPESGQRLPALDAAGQPLPDHSLKLEVKP